jgi:transposase
MNMHVSFVAAGVDIGRDHLDVAIAPTGLVKRVPNTEAGVAKLLAALHRHEVKTLVIEAIGPYSHRLIRALRGLDLSVGIVNPQRIRAWRTAEGKRAKNDRLDAQAIARFALSMPDVYRPLPDEASLKMKAVSARRRQIVEMIAIEKTRLKQATEPLVLESHKATLAALAEACAAIEAEISGRLARDPERAAAQRLLRSVPGIGARVCAVLITELPELGQRDRKTIASLVGLAPQVSQSGAAPPRAAIAGGRPCVRAALYMSALVAVRHDPVQKAAYQALRAQGKPAKVALVAIARRILVTANAILKTKQPYNPNFRLDP